MVRVAAAVAALAVALIAGRAEACSCRTPGFVFEGEGVPRNAKLALLGPFVTEVDVRLLAGDGQEIATRVEPVPGGLFVVPNEPLVANTVYSFLHDSEVAGFTTGPDLDVTAPPAPTLTGFTAHPSSLIRSSNCDLGGDAFMIFVESGSPREAFEVLEVFVGARTDAIDTAQPALVVGAPEGAFYLGDASACSRNFATSTMGDLAVQLRSRDAAGNVSEFSNAVQLKGGGCSATAGATAGLGWLVLPLARGRRRRG